MDGNTRIFTSDDLIYYLAEQNGATRAGRLGHLLRCMETRSQLKRSATDSGSRRLSCQTIRSITPPYRYVSSHNFILDKWNTRTCIIA